MNKKNEFGHYKVEEAKGLFIWSCASPLGKASHSKRAEFHLAFYVGIFWPF